MTRVMEGVRVLEVAEHTFVPAASALLSDWGAEVIKIEPAERGDAMRGLASTGVVSITGDVHALLEHSNRGKRSLALDLTSPDGLDILYKLVGDRRRLPHQQAAERPQEAQDRARGHPRPQPADHLRRRHGHGERGPDADKGSYDSLAFWQRAGVALGGKPADMDRLPLPPRPVSATPSAP